MADNINLIENADNIYQGKVDMDKIIGASFGEASSTLRATFKKTVNVKQYETETVEISSTLEMDRELSGVERMLASAILQAQLEYDGYVQMRAKGYVTNEQLFSRRTELVDAVNLIKKKGEEILGKSLDYIFEMKQNT